MARPRRFREVSDDELATILNDLSEKYHDGVWGVRAGEFDRLKPSDISRFNRQLSRRYLPENKDGWKELTLRLIGREPKPLAWAEQVPPPVVKSKETWGDGPLFDHYWTMYCEEGMPAIEGFRVVGEWCPITHKYIPTQYEKVMMLR